jgi:hypothetical protein
VEESLALDRSISPPPFTTSMQEAVGEIEERKSTPPPEKPAHRFQTFQRPQTLLDYLSSQFGP